MGPLLVLVGIALVFVGSPLLLFREWVGRGLLPGWAIAAALILLGVFLA